MLKTLAQNAIIEIQSRPASFHLASAHLLGGRESHLHTLNEAQDCALGEISGALHAQKFQPLLLHGVTGSGKTAVYLAAMRRALDSGR
jgi:primosomal protein N' (replication factor Y)